jgi:hypothetical protein
MTLQIDNCVYDAVVVIDGSYKGWVGYILRKELEGYIKLRVFSSDGSSSDIELPVEYIINVEPKQLV